MAFLEINNVHIAGFAAAVPKQIEENTDYPYFEEGEAKKFISSTSVERRRVARDGVITSDLCIAAAEKLIEDLGWDKSDIDCLILVTQTPDYILPATACIIQSRLGLSNECYAMDISLGCSGWVYGLSTISSLLSHGNMKKGLLLVGETTHMQFNPLDKSGYPLFGDAGTVTAIEYKENESGFKFHLSTDGSGYDAIIIEDGGYRNWINEDSLKIYTTEDGIKRTRLNTTMDGMSVFSFAISQAPESFNKLTEHFAIDREKLDFYVMHQANYFMNNKIRKKIGIAEEKVPYSMKNFGNTSGASIPLTIVTECASKIKEKPCDFIACGFGVGLSWGSVYFKTDKNIIVSELVEI